MSRGFFTIIFFYFCVYFAQIYLVFVIASLSLSRAWKPKISGYKVVLNANMATNSSGLISFLRSDFRLVSRFGGNIFTQDLSENKLQNIYFDELFFLFFVLSGESRCNFLDMSSSIARNWTTLLCYVTELL